MKFFPVAAFLILTFFASYSQDLKGDITGQVYDQANAKAVAYATVSIYKSQDTTLMGYKLTDEKGSFKLTSIPLNVNLRLVITFTGYEIKRHEVHLTPNQTAINLGKIHLIPTIQNIDEIIIKAERPPVMIRKDTIEFNAAAFKTLPDALVEDLLRKLPGVNVDKDGDIRVNGKTVTTIYVDGKEFFGGDVRIASKNLPANTIDKVEVMNDAEALRINPLLQEADIPQVINLKLKPGIKKGIFGKLYVGGGVKEKHEAGGLVNLFRDTTQLSILAYTNDLNKAGFSFTDIRSVGGFGRSGWGNANGNGNGGLSIDNVSFGGFGSGLMNSFGGGGNFNTIVSNKVLFSLTYFYGGVDSKYEELKNNQQDFNGDRITTKQLMSQGGNNNAHLLGSKLGFNITPKLKIEVKPQMVISKDRTSKIFDINSRSDLNGLLNQSDNNQLNHTHNNTLFIWTKIMPTLSKGGRTLDISHHSVIEQSDLGIFNFVKNIFFQPSSETILDQLRKNDIKNSSSNVSVRFTDPLSKSLVISSGLNFNYQKNTNHLNTYFPDENGQYVSLIDILSENYTLNVLKSNLNAVLRWKRNKLSISPGVTLSNFNSNSTFSRSADIQQQYFYLLPALEINYGILSLSYNSDYRAPVLANLQPLIDNTNPLFIRQGNPDLKPLFNKTLNFGIRKYDVKNAFTYNVNFSSTNSKNATIISRTINTNGAQQSMPVNAASTWSHNSNLSFQKDWKSGHDKISLLASNSVVLSNSYVLINQVKSKLKAIQLRPAAEVRINLNDQLEFNQSYSLLKAKNSYASNFFSSQNLIFHDSRSEIILRPTTQIILESTLDYRYNSNAIPGLLRDYYKWNAAVSYVFLTGNRGIIKLSVNDLLDQNILANRLVRENYIEDIQGTTLRRHGLLTFTYNIRNFGGKIGGRNSLF